MLTSFHLSGVMLLGGTRTQILKSSFYSYLVPAYEDLYWSNREQTGKTGQKRSMECQLKRHDLSLRWVRCEIQADQSPAGEVLQWKMVLVDITRQKQAEKEREQLEIELRHTQKIQSIGVLAGGIAHEFNNIMTIIIGNNELAMDDHAKGLSVGNYLHEIDIASHRAKEIVRQLLAFGRKSGHATIPIDIRAIPMESLSLIRSTLPANIDMQWNISDQNLTVVADPTQIQQIVINICKNAADAVPKEN